MTHDAPSMTVAELIDTLVQRHETLAVAESLTGGLLCASIVDVPGASRVFRGGLVAYATDLKAALAGVPAQLLRECGAVHPDVAVALAAGARDRCGADWGVGVTGVAGPDPQDGRPAGTVFVAVTGPGGTQVGEHVLPGDRAAVRAAAVTAALDLLAGRVSPPA